MSVASAHMVPPWDEAHLNALLESKNCKVRVFVLQQCASTNTELVHMLQAGRTFSGMTLVVEEQTHGRGRSKKHWHHTPGGLAFSLLWSMQRMPLALSLLVGLSLLEGLKEVMELPFDDQALSLKWPNDVWLASRKLAGILVETHNYQQMQQVIIGVGLNLYHAPALPQTGALVELGKPMPHRELILATLLENMAKNLAHFDREGFAPFRQRWLKHHALAGKNITVEDAGKNICGRCGDIDATGRLAVHTSQDVIHILSGHISCIS